MTPQSQKQAKLIITWEKGKNGIMMSRHLSGNWNADVGRFAIESIYDEVEKKSPLCRWWELIWRAK